jgi:phosphatidate cytidylyltransferase
VTELQTRTLSGVAMIAIAVICLWSGGIAFSLLVAAAGLAMLYEWSSLASKMGWGVSGQIAGALYVLPPITGLSLLRRMEDGFGLTLWTLAIVWATDIFAYFFGRTIGGPKIAPSISPSKTWAGLVGGMIGAGLTGIALTRQFNLPDILNVLGAPLAVLAQCGDFFESWMKRRAGVKDSGQLIPGHGGVMDRLDGVVPVASVMGALALAGMF